MNPTPRSIKRSTRGTHLLLFLSGTQFTWGLIAAIQEWMGKEAYLAWAEEGWVEWPWWVGAVLMVIALVLAVGSHRECRGGLLMLHRVIASADYIADVTRNRFDRAARILRKIAASDQITKDTYKGGGTDTECVGCNAVLCYDPPDREPEPHYPNCFVQDVFGWIELEEQEKKKSGRYPNSAGY